MTPEQKRLVRDTWKQVAPVAEAAAGMFYHRLFEIDPTTRKLFPRDRYGGSTQKAVADAGTGSRSGVDASRGVGVERSLSPAVGHHAQRRRARRAPAKRVARAV